MAEMPIDPISEDNPPPARAVVYEVKCAQDGFVARGTFEEFPVAGWVIVPNQEGGPPAWFCPACVHGIKRVGSVQRHPVARQAES